MNVIAVFGCVWL